MYSTYIRKLVVLYAGPCETRKPLTMHLLRPVFIQIATIMPDSSSLVEVILEHATASAA